MTQQAQPDGDFGRRTAVTTSSSLREGCTATEQTACFLPLQTQSQSVENALVPAPSAGPYEEPAISGLSGVFDFCVESFGACTWLRNLPTMITKSHPSLTLLYGARATCLVLYAKLTNDWTHQIPAVRWYFKGLQEQRRIFAQLDDHSQAGSTSELASEEAICATILMCYFEIVMRSVPEAWIQHIDAAAVLISIRPPETCQTGLAHQLFISVRLGTVSLRYGVICWRTED